MFSISQANSITFPIMCHVDIKFKNKWRIQEVWIFETDVSILIAD